MEIVSGYGFWNRPKWGDVLFANNVFTSDEVDEIVRLGKQANPKPATNSQPSTKEFRDSLASFIFPNEANEWVFERISNLVVSSNEEFFNYDIFGLFEGLQFAEYASNGQHISWHVDRAPSLSNRKLSLSIQLSSPDSYDGGNFELLTADSPTETPREKGSAIIFSSFVLHRVTPVLRGTRHSLVAWVAGPPFR